MRPRTLAYLLAIALAASIAYDLFRMPIQVSDSLGELISVQVSPSAATTFLDGIRSKAYFRPLRMSQIKVVFDASAGHYHLAYRGFHVALFLLTIGLFVRALRVTTASDLAAAAFALTVFTGLHTFMGTVASAYPINHFLEMMMFSLLTLNLAQGRGGWPTDAAVALTFASAALTLESGLLVWVVAAAAWFSGMPGISRRGLIIVTVLLASYFYFRFAFLATGAPSLIERSSGFLLSTLEPEELQNRFGSNPLPFYAYNIVSSVLSVLFAEPRHGVWVGVRAWLQDDMRPWVVVAIVSSSITTLLIVTAAWHWARSSGQKRLRPLRRAKSRSNSEWGWGPTSGEMEQPNRLFLVFAAVLLANSALSYAYTKDEIVSIAGAFYALAAYAAVRHLLASSAARGVLLQSLLCIALVPASVGWAIRSEGLHYALRTQAFKHRNDWAVSPPRPPGEVQALQLIRQLRTDAFERTVVNPRFVPYWFTRWFEET